MKKQHLNFNTLAPDLDLPDTGGRLVHLSDLWRDRPLLLAFTRHFGCTQCKEMLSELTAGQASIQSAGLGMAVITQGTPETAAVFAAQYAPGLLVLADPQRKAYHAFGLERGDMFQTFINPRVWKAISNARKKGYKVEMPPEGQDAMQMSGTFIISRDGHIALPYYYDHIADHPPLDLLLKGVLSTNWNQPYNGPVGPSQDKTR